ncbi:DUF2975 domain-containing protein [Sphingomonas sp. KR3-1]|uniref:DUF2975 domain-containing protein n=1 Tax=Sphingomonas sp. KR3-1 TaxID=3156611 RepID=UPI0032B3B482
MLKLTIGVLRVLLVLNIAAALFFVVVLAGSYLVEAPLLAHLARKYPASVDIRAVVDVARLMLVLGLAVVPPAQILLVALLRMVRTVEQGDPFVSANARRLHAIGWALLVLQLGDMAFGVLAGWIMRLGAQFGTGWSFSLTGWLGVLLVFVLARIFAQGTAMREELEMTV